MPLASYEEKRIQEIRNFEECIQDGFELYTTGKSAMEYHFGNQKLRQVFEAAFSSEEQKNECIDLADRLFFIIERDTMKHIRNQLERGLSRDESKLYVRRICVFWQIYELEQVDGLINDEVRSRMHRLLSEIDRSIPHFKDKTELKNLPSDLILSLESLSLYDRSSPVPHLNRLSQIDSAIYKTGCDTSIEDDPEEEVSNDLFEKTNVLMDGLLNGEVNIDNLKIVHESDTLIKPSHSTALAKRLFSMWFPLIDSIDSKVRDASLRVLRFVLLSTKYRNDMVHQFHEMYMNEKKSLPSFTQSSILPEGKKVITALINEMGSHDEMQKDREKSERVLRQFHWLALISPEDVISSLLQRCFTDRRIVAPSVKLISSLSTLSSAGLVSSTLTLIARSTDYTIGEEREALVYLIASLTRQKKNGSEVPLMSAYKAFSSFVADSIASNNEDKLSVALSLLVRLFSTGETKHSLFHFSPALGEKDHEESVEAADLLLFLLDLMGRSGQEGNNNIFELTKKTIKQMGAKLREDGVVFNEDTSQFILSRISSHEWFVKVAVTQWFSSVLGDPPRQIPSGLLACLSVEQTHLFEQIIVSFEFSPVECFLRSLYEVCIWDLPFALSFLNLGVAIPPLDDNLADKLSVAMVDVSSPFHSSQWQSLLPFLPLTLRLVDILDVSIDCRLERINGAIYHSVQNQRALNVIAKATKLAFLTNEGEEGRHNHWALLQLFCSAAKSHVDAQMESWTKFQRMKAKDEFNGVASLPTASLLEKVSSTEYVATQCATLFPLAVSLTHIVPKVPSCLQVLISTVSGYLSEFYNRPPPSSLDAAPTGSVRDTTVYAYSAKASSAAGDYSNQGATREHSATNQLFGITRSIGTARVINDSTMALLIEKKLTSREDVRSNGENKSAYSNHPTTNTTNSSKKKNNRRKK